MATRRERVILDLEDNYTSKVARATVATSLLNKELGSLSGSAVQSERDLDRQTKSVDRAGKAARDAGPDIDKFSGRLGLLRDAAITLGPALIPLGASTIPVLTASLVGLGAAAGGIAVAVLAFKGVGDGLKALDAFQAEQTAENLQALRVELEKLGPAGAEFVHYLDDLEPQLKNLQNLARIGIFPGVEDGIDELLTRLPQIRRIVADLALGMGDLSRDAGQALGGDEFSAFFKYIETDARPTLEAFAHSVGNVALGVANMLVAFAPLTRDFTGGLEDATKAFARWSAGLDDNDSFQSFLAYVRESGPQVIDLLGALATAIASLLQAAAPLGRAVVPALTAVAKAFSAIADSPVGPALYTATAALIAFNRAASLTSRANTSLRSSFTRLNTEAQGTTSRLSGLVGRGGVVLAGAAAVGMLADNINRIDPSNLDRSLTALKFGDVTDDVDKVIDSISGLEDKWNKVDLGKVVTLGGLLGASTSDRWKDNIDQVDKSLANLVESGHADEAAALFQKISDLASAKGVDPSDTAKRFDAYATALDNLNHSAGAAKSPLDAIGESLRDGKEAAQDFTGALAALNGWFDKRDAIRSYRESVETLSKSLKNGFGPKDAANLDAMGRSILQVAQSIKDPGTKRDFLAGARASLVDLANNAGPKAEAAIQRVITKMDSEGLTHPKLIPLGVDDKATPTLEQLDIHLRRTGNTNPKPTVTVDPGNSLSLLDQIARLLGSLHSKTIDVTVNRRGGVTSSAGGHSTPDPAETVTPRTHTRTSSDPLDKMSTRGGINVSPRATKTGGVSDLDLAARGAASGLRGLKAQLDQTQKAFDKAKNNLDDAKSRRDSISGSIQSGLTGDSIWAASSGSVWSAGAHGANDPASALTALNERKARAQRLVAAINTLKQKGVNGAALLEIIGDGDVERAEAMAALDVGSLGSFAGAVNDSNTALAAAGLAGGNAVEGDNIRAANKRLDRLHTDLQEVKQAIKDAEKANDRASDRNADKVGDHVNGAADRGNRNQVYGGRR